MKMNMMTYDNSRNELNQKLCNSIAYYEALASGKNDFNPDGRINWNYRTTFHPSIEQRAEAIAEEQRKYLETPTRYGEKNGVSAAVSSVRFDALLMKTRKDQQLGELAAIGRAAVLQENLLDLLKTVKKLSPTQKARKAHNKSDYYDVMFNRVTLHFTKKWLHVDMHIIDEFGQPARVSIAKRAPISIDTAYFSVNVEWTTLLEVIKTYEKECLNIQYRDWVSKFVIKQGRTTTRLPVSS
jgi:hypothetical protein